MCNYMKEILLALKGNIKNDCNVIFKTYRLHLSDWIHVYN